MRFSNIDTTYAFRMPTVEKELLLAIDRVVIDTCNVLTEVLIVLENNSGSDSSRDLLQNKITEIQQAKRPRQTREICNLLITKVEVYLQGTTSKSNSELKFIILREKMFPSYRDVKLFNEFMQATALASAEELIEELNATVPGAISMLLENRE